MHMLMSTKNGYGSEAAGRRSRTQCLVPSAWLDTGAPDACKRPAVGTQSRAQSAPGSVCRVLATRLGVSCARRSILTAYMAVTANGKRHLPVL